MDVKLEENEELVDLGIDNLQLIQNKKYFCFGLDAILLSDFAKDINGLVLDIGSGTGILSVLLSSKSNANKIIAIEKQKEMANIIQKNIKLNKLEKVSLLNIDIMDYKKHFEMQKIDNIVINPPYKSNGSGIENQNSQINLSKIESTATLSDFIEISSKLLKPNRNLYIVYRPDRLTSLIYNLRKNNLEPKLLRFVYSNQMQDNAKLILLKATKCAKEFLKVQNPLYIYNDNNEYTNEIYKIYNIKKKG